MLHANDNPVVRHPDLFDGIIRIGFDRDTGRDLHARGSHAEGALVVFEICRDHEDVLRRPVPAVRVR